MVACERYYKSKNKVLAYAFTFISVETVKELKIDLNNESELLDFLEHKSYEISESSILEIKHSSAGNSLNPKYKLVGGNQCDLVLETLYANDYSPPILLTNTISHLNIVLLKLKQEKKNNLNF